MSLLFESIRVLQRTPLNLEYHNRRVNGSRRELFGLTDAIDLRERIRIPADLSPDEYKCRVVYGETIERVEFNLYRPKPIRSLTLVECHTISYAHKFLDRQKIEELLQGIETDDILIVKNGFITDASFANVVFHDGVGWVTPSTPLLPGTARSRLIDEGRIRVEDIRVGDLPRFTKAALINAMLDLDDQSTIPMQNIIRVKT